tara:strand:+ start:1005 stop:1358 length:354 start_codon:yes stop_codon:yes gene_type:complete
MKEEKIWGFTEEIFANRLFEFHRLEYKKGFNCSEHIHKYKWNAFYIESGKMIVRVWNSKSDLEDYEEFILKSGDFKKVEPGRYHQFEGLEDGVAFEVYWGEFNHDDIERRKPGTKVE